MRFFSTFLLAMTVLSIQSLTAQVAINTDGSNPDPSAMLDIKSTAKGMLVPRMTSFERLAIPAPVVGLLVYQTNAPAGFYFFKGGIWQMISEGTPSWLLNGANISNTNSGNVGIGVPNPTSKLEVGGQIKSTGGYFGIVQEAEGKSLGTYIGGEYAGWFGTISNHPLWFYVNGGLASMAIDTTGQVGIGTIAPDVSAALDVSSSNKGFLPPRMTAADRSAIATPAEGLLVYQTDAPAGLYYYSGGAWAILSSGANNWANDGANISNTNSGNVGIGASNPTSKFEVAGQIKSTDFYSGIVQEAGNISLGTYIGGENAGWFGTNSNHPLWFYTNNGYASMVIETTGKVGIGTISPQSLLEIQYNPYNYTQLGYTNSTLNMTYHHQLANEGDGQAALYGLSPYVCNLILL
jgi:hypothetical protein